MKKIIKNSAIGGGIISTILASVFYIEGGFVNDPLDPGGATKYGITENVARAHGYTGKMENLTKNMATDIYTTTYIEKPGFNEMVPESTAVAHKLIDAGINVGPRLASTWFQIALNRLNRGGIDYPSIIEDGYVGIETIEAYRALVNKRGDIKACELIIKLIDSQQALHYMNLTHLAQYTVGWIDHRIGNIPLCFCKEYGTDE